MMTRAVHPLSAGTWIAMLGLLACEGERTTVTEPIGPVSYNFRISVGTSKGLARSAGLDASYLALVSFDTSVTDAFGRKGDLSVARRSTTGWDLRSTVRRRVVDGRVPLLSPTGSPDASLLTLLGPEAAGGFWRLNFSFSGLAASTAYKVQFARYRLRQVDSLDHTAALYTGSNFTQPDSLIVLGGTPGAVAAGGCTSTSAVVPVATDNPLVIGTFTSSSGGASGTLARCFTDANALWYSATRVDLARTPIAPNRGVSFLLPQYNYIEVVGVASGTVVLRAQIGQDLDASGNPINNAFAPMPCRATGGRCTASNVLSTRAKISAPGGEGRVDSVQVSLRGLKGLSGGGVYQAWLINPATAAAPVPAVGRILAIRVDTITDVPVLDTDTTVLVSTAATSTFSGYDMPTASRVRYTLMLTGASTGVSLRDYTHVLFTLEAAAATSPSSRRALWARYGDQRGTATDYKDDEWVDAPALAWGSIDAAGATYTFAVAGRGLGGFRGDEVSVDLDDLSRPPIGYYYQAWLVDVNAGPAGRDTVYLAVDTLRAPYPGRALLYHADSALVDPVVQSVPPIISSANFRNFAASLGLSGDLPYAAYENFIITLEPKGSDATKPGPHIVFLAAVPSVVRTGP